MAALNSGLADSLDCPTLNSAADVSCGENHAFWFFDDKGRYSLLNCHIQGGGTVPAGRVVAGEYRQFEDWATRRIVFPLAGPDGELMVDFAIAPGAEPNGYRLGGWEFRCIKPFKQWTGRYHGMPRLTSTEETRAGVIDLAGPRVAVEINLDMIMATPAWMRGRFAQPIPGMERGLLATGIPRYEQLFRLTGEIRVAGRESHAFTGTGLRTHRYGRRVATGSWFLGSSWLSAIFPSGRAFGSVQYLGDGGVPCYSDSTVTDATGALISARCIETPWLESHDIIGRAFRIAFELPDGSATRIDGEVVAAAYNYGFGIDRSPGVVNWCHTMSRFRWDGEEAYGAMELGMMVDRVKF